VIRAALSLNAIRNGLTAETVISTLEERQITQGSKAAIIADYDAQSAVERELVLRLARLLGDCRAEI
jgi:hypothetical protein